MKKSKRRSRALIGDVVRIQVGKGCAHLQYVGKDKYLGWLVLVGPYMETAPDEITPAVLDKAYYIYYPVHTALSQQLVEWVGKLPLRPTPTCWRWDIGGVWQEDLGVMGELRWRIHDRETGEGYYTDKLTPEEIEFPVQEGMNHEALLKMIKFGWRPEKFVNNYKEPWDRPPPTNQS